MWTDMLTQARLSAQGSLNPFITSSVAVKWIHVHAVCAHASVGTWRGGGLAEENWLAGVTQQTDRQHQLPVRQLFLLCNILYVSLVSLVVILYVITTLDVDSHASSSALVHL